MNTVVKIIFFLIIGYFVWNYYNQNWTAFYYPDGVDIESTWQIKSGFKSKEACIDYINSIMDATKPDVDYECGRNCRVEYGVDICEVTEQ